MVTRNLTSPYFIGQNFTNKLWEEFTQPLIKKTQREEINLKSSILFVSIVHNTVCDLSVYAEYPDGPLHLPKIKIFLIKHAK